MKNLHIRHNRPDTISLCGDCTGAFVVRKAGAELGYGDSEFCPDCLRIHSYSSSKLESEVQDETFADKDEPF